MSEWIDINNEKPKKDSSVIIHRIERLEISGQISVVEQAKYTADGSFVAFYYEGASVVDGVKHWMYMPELPDEYTAF